MIWLNANLIQYKIMRLIIFLMVLCSWGVYANIEKEYYLVYKKLEYFKGVYGNINKYANLNYEYQGVNNNYRLYVDNTNNEQELILWNLDENWEINRLKVNKRVQEFWGYVNNYGIFVIYKRSNDIYWKIYRTNTGQEIIGGFLTSEDVLNLKLKDTYFASYKQGAFCSLVFQDNLGTQKYQIYYIDIWGRHDLVTQK
ncbi:MAG: hypothetical protein NZM44_02590 [Candidatus Calescibacterium sp.]|nr:hypothetical protein [Candidatus Calescibacterium sp.]MCX7758549.1 hypothetical protein [bacterium]